jgi:hypothetical protein
MLEIGHIHSEWAVTLRANHWWSRCAGISTHRPRLKFNANEASCTLLQHFFARSAQKSDCLNPDCTTPVRQIEFPDGAVFASIKMR